MPAWDRQKPLEIKDLQKSTKGQFVGKLQGTPKDREQWLGGALLAILGRLRTLQQDTPNNAKLTQHLCYFESSINTERM